MRFQIPMAILQEIDHPEFESVKRYKSVDPGDLETTHGVSIERLEDETLQSIRSVAADLDAGKFLRAFEAVLEAREGTSDFKVPSFQAFPQLLVSYLRERMIHGWIFEHSERSGQFLAWAVTKVRLVEPSPGTRSGPYVEMTGVAYGPSDGRLKTIRTSWIFEPSDVSRRKVEKILEKKGLFVETDALHEDYEVSDRRFEETLRDGFARQYRVTGPVESYGDGRRFGDRRDPRDAVGARAIMDIDPDRIHSAVEEVETSVFGDQSDTVFVSLPAHPLVELYNLSTHEAIWVPTDHIEPYVYRPELRDSLILPEDQRDLLDILTTDTDMLTGDLIEGKAAGNVILTKGVPGVGKTLTAEVYAEVCRKPLYAVHAGNLGTSPQSIAENLQVVFQRARRWGCVLLLDEADVFVMTRGRDVVQNAIVAEFLRTLEYFDGLLFMTSNRGDDIDDAILSRCAAIIQYDIPGHHLLADVWRVMATNFEADLSDELIAELVDVFPDVTQRDVKALLRLVLRVSIAREQPLDLALFRRYAPFRGITAAETSGERQND